MCNLIQVQTPVRSNQILMAADSFIIVFILVLYHVFFCFINAGAVCSRPIFVFFFFNKI